MTEEIYRDSIPALVEWHNRWYGQTVFCLGTGPSLAEQDLSLLGSRPVVACNHAHRLLPAHPGPMWNMVSDSARLEELREELLATHRLLLTIPNNHTARQELYQAPAYCIRPEGSQTEPGFSDNLLKGVWPNHSVIFIAIQFAAWIGATRIVLLGVDMDYSGKMFFQEGITRPSVPPGDDYEWHRPSFELCRDHLAVRGVELLNGAPAGKVDCLTRVRLEDA